MRHARDTLAHAQRIGLLQMMEDAMERRAFLKTAMVAGVAAAAGEAHAEPNVAGAVTATARPQVEGMLYRQLGTTGETVSAIGLGGYHVGKQADPADSIRLIRAAIDRGITFLDNCWDYHDGLSEVRMGQALKDGYRQKVFLMTKMDGRTSGEYSKQLEQSLGRLQTDTIDLVQFHECIRLEDPDRIFAAGGALEAAVAARQAGKIRYIGFTGHKDPAVHLRMFEMAEKHGFKFDTVQMPVNVMDAHFRSFTRQVIPVAQRQGTGVLAMKTFGDHAILDTGLVPPRGDAPLRAVAAGVGGDYGHRQAGDSRSGARGGPHLPAHDSGADAGRSGEDAGGRERWEVRVVQDDQPLRRDGAESEVAGLKAG